MGSLLPRHIQNFSDTDSLEHHWGYYDRAVPCTNDAGSCAYLDVVYHSHDLSMIYSGIFWASIAAILIVWGASRLLFTSTRKLIIRNDDEIQLQLDRRDWLYRFTNAAASTSRRYLLPNAIIGIFGHTTRLQVIILLTLSGYLAIWTFIGIIYRTWITPVEDMPGVYNTRTSLGPWSDRVGILAYALTPLSILLASRESILSIITGIPYTSFMFLHRWTGYIIIVQSILHTISWTIIEGRLYQPQPSVWNGFVAETYIQWGWVALGLLLLMWLLTFSWTIRHITGYEFFRKAHYILAMVYIGAIIGHWKRLSCFLIPGILLWALDRLTRLVRSCLLHYKPHGTGHGFGFSAAKAQVQMFEDEAHGDVVRLDFEYPQVPWHIGQHFYLCFTESNIWQSHPFTPLSLPIALENRTVKHSYLLRAKRGETRNVAIIAKARLMIKDQETSMAPTISVVLQGPYGGNIMNNGTTDGNILCIAGGTGITYVLPVLLQIATSSPIPGRRVELVWAMRRKTDIDWIRPEMEQLYAAWGSHCINIRIFVTNDKMVKDDDETASPESTTLHEKAGSLPQISVYKDTSVCQIEPNRPHLDAVVRDFVDSVTRGATTVYGSGPLSMIDDLRESVANCNSGSKVWKGEERYDVQLICDDRLEG